MLPFFTEQFGNAASRNHAFGWEAEEAVEDARKQIADLIGASAKEIIFTSGATEATTSPSRAWPRCTREGQPRHHLRDRAQGHPRHLQALEKQAARSPTCRCSSTAGSTSTSSARRSPTRRSSSRSWPPTTRSARCSRSPNRHYRKEKGVLFHTDAVQAAGKIPFDVKQTEGRPGVDDRPQDLRAEGYRRAVRAPGNPRVLLAEQIDGGGHERGMRSGTLNVTGIVGFGKAAAIAKTEMATESERLRGLRERLNAAPHPDLDEMYLNGPTEHAAGQREHQLRLRRGRGADDGDQGRGGVVGSACTSASLEPTTC